MFFRVKAALIAVLVVAGVTVATAQVLSSRLRDRATQRVEADVLRAQQVLLSQSRLEGFDLASLALGFAREDSVVQIFSKPTVEEQQKAAFVEIEVRKARVEKRDAEGAGDAAKVGILGVVDARGALLARDLQPAWRRGDVLTAEFPSLDAALKGGFNKDVWNLDGAMYRVGAAAIKGPQGNVLGAVFVGFVQSVTDAKTAEQLLGAEVAYFLDNKIHASSFDHRPGASDSVEENTLAAQLFEGPKYGEKAVTGRQATPAFHLTIRNDEWVAAAAPLLGNATQSKSGFVVLQSLRDAHSHVSPVVMAVYVLGLVAVLMIIISTQLTERRFLVPLDRLEAGVSEVINGNQEYVFERPSPDFEGLANGLNVMLARLLGRPEPDDDEDADDKVTTSVVDMP